MILEKLLQKLLANNLSLKGTKTSSDATFATPSKPCGHSQKTSKPNKKEILEKGSFSLTCRKLPPAMATGNQFLITTTEPYKGLSLLMRVDFYKLNLFSNVLFNDNTKICSYNVATLVICTFCYILSAGRN